MFRVSRHTLRQLILPGLVAVAAPAMPAIALAQGSGHYKLSGHDVVIYNLIGVARVVHGTGPDVTIDVETGGADGADLRVETGTLNEKPTLRVVYSGDRFVYDELGRGSSTQMQVQDDGTFGHGFGGRRVRISGSGSGKDAHADLTISVPDGKYVVVHQAVGKLGATDVKADLKLDTAAAPVSASGITGALNVDVGSGSVDVSNCTGDVHVDTGSGEVSMNKVSGTSLYVDTGSGGIDGDDLKAEKVHMDTGSGSIEVSTVNASDLKLDTGSGSIRVELASDVESAMIETGSGGVTLGVPESLGAELRISTGSGGIDVDVPHENSRERRSAFRGTIGDGKGDIMISTGSGGVHVLASRER